MRNYSAKPTVDDYIRKHHDAFLPYGRWTCANGRVVLFNRHYNPIWQKSPDGTLSPADPKEWIEGITKAEYFYDDGCPPEHIKRTFRRCMKALFDFGVYAYHASKTYKRVPAQFPGISYRDGPADGLPPIKTF